MDAPGSDLAQLLDRSEALVRAAAAFKKDEQAVRAPGRAEHLVAAARAKSERARLSPEVADRLARHDRRIHDLELTEH
ncbi:hypothetical protein [Streptomyces sp. NPDC001978]|uniref:hypothetical protein n=1 Tax=Streptomyces sp. NPDC001978 TaxID=3364627 RepID=UPI003679C7E2